MKTYIYPYTHTIRYIFVHRSLFRSSFSFSQGPASTPGMLFCRPCSTGVLNVGSPCECFMIWWCFLVLSDFRMSFWSGCWFAINIIKLLDGWFLLIKFVACVEFKLSYTFSIFLWFYNDAPLVFPWKSLSWALWIEGPGMVELDWENLEFQAVLDTKMCWKWIQLKNHRFCKKQRNHDQ